MPFHDFFAIVVHDIRPPNVESVPGLLQEVEVTVSKQGHLCLCSIHLDIQLSLPIG